MATTTPNYDLILPGVNDATDQDLWGGYLNDDLTDIDALLKVAIDTVTSEKTTTYVITDADRNKAILADATAGIFNLTLPTPAVVGDGFNVIVKKIDSSSNEVTIIGTIDGESNYVLKEENSAVSLFTDGTDWFVKSNNFDSTFSNQSLTENGYQSLPGGMIMQWGTYDTAMAWDSEVTITFPLAFPTACLNISLTSLIDLTAPDPDDNNGEAQLVKDSETLTNFKVRAQDFNVLTASTFAGFKWFAIGN